ncbi:MULTISPECIES: hypothetical protein [Limnohabitans]|jgi:hypothetical protein|nr:MULTISPECIES: hypothetical protein [Limnohabitans]
MNILSHPMLRQTLIGVVCVAVLLGVLSMYLRPDFLLTLANQVWGCF